MDSDICCKIGPENPFVEAILEETLVNKSFGCYEDITSLMSRIFCVAYSQPSGKMMVEDIGIEAKDPWLPLPELLLSISSTKLDYIARQQANDTQLSTIVAEQDVKGMMSIFVETAVVHESLGDDKG